MYTALVYQSKTNQVQESYPIQEVFRVLELKDICYTLPDGKEILKHIDLTVRDNEFTVITGPNAAVNPPSPSSLPVS